MPPPPIVEPGSMMLDGVLTSRTRWLFDFTRSVEFNIKTTFAKNRILLLVLRTLNQQHGFVLCVICVPRCAYRGPSSMLDAKPNRLRRTAVVVSCSKVCEVKRARVLLPTPHPTPLRDGGAPRARPHAMIPHAKG